MFLRYATMPYEQLRQTLNQEIFYNDILLNLQELLYLFRSVIYTLYLQ